MSRIRRLSLISTTPPIALLTTHPDTRHDQAFTPEELVAMILTHAKDITKAYGGVPVRDAVLVVPAFYTQPERQALMDAADIADIKVGA